MLDISRTIDASRARVYEVWMTPEKLSWSGEFSGGAADQVAVEVTFEDASDKTIVRVVQAFHTMTPKLERAAKGARQGWTRTLNQLASFCTQAESVTA